MLNFLEILTGIKASFPIPYYAGGGLHQIKPGGNLEVHADFNYHPKLKLDRRINVLVYLNKDWKEEYGGHFELWNKEMTAAEREDIAALQSLRHLQHDQHLVSRPSHASFLPAGRTRKSLATYYYSVGRPEEEISDVTARSSSIVQARTSRQPEGHCSLQ
jgi:hypothetical protein